MARPAGFSCSAPPAPRVGCPAELRDSRKEHPMATSSKKKKATAKEHATRHAAARGGSERPKVPASEKARSQSRFPGERALTGADRPANRAGGKIKGQSGGARPAAQGNPRAKGAGKALS